MNSLVMEGFQYPENPEWSVQEDEVQDMIDRMNGAKRLWPLLRLVRTFVPLFRDILCGFIEEEDHKPVGLINYMRQRNAPEWYIANVTVLPAYRRRGIARRLVEATLEELRQRKAEVAFLDVVVGNDPAFNLYKEMGFDPFTKSSEYYFQKDIMITPMPLPEGYRLKSLSRFDWQTRFDFARRITPEHITRYEPVTEARFRIPMIMLLFGAMFEAAGGSHSERFAIYAPDEEVVSIGQYSYRTRTGGINFTKLSIDPNHQDLAEFILHYVFSTIQKVSPGHRTELSFEDWEVALIQCAEEIGCEKRWGFHHMGLRF
ncbi:MAG TPA: GNAT family N-acetyltransferase [Anaerolineales bacterium]|nr:GNAT family N-acetyltransferase [Anaerolineales bacterium]